MLIVVALTFLFFKSPSAGNNTSREILYSDFKEYVAKGYVEKVVAYDNNKVEVTIIPDSAARILGQSMVQTNVPVMLTLEVGSIESLDRYLDEQEKTGAFKGKLDYKKKDNTLNNLFWNIFPFILLIGAKDVTDDINIIRVKIAIGVSSGVKVKYTGWLVDGTRFDYTDSLGVSFYLSELRKCSEKLCKRTRKIAQEKR